MLIPTHLQMRIFDLTGLIGAPFPWVNSSFRLSNQPIKTRNKNVRKVRGRRRENIVVKMQKGWNYKRWKREWHTEFALWMLFTSWILKSLRDERRGRGLKWNHGTTNIHHVILRKGRNKSYYIVRLLQTNIIPCISHCRTYLWRALKEYVRVENRIFSG